MGSTAAFGPAFKNVFVKAPLIGVGTALTVGAYEAVTHKPLSKQARNTVINTAPPVAVIAAVAMPLAFAKHSLRTMPIVGITMASVLTAGLMAMVGASLLPAAAPDKN
ncbi:MAG: hypothetical protein JWN41_929 [Thermoleophilia bacterium]|nr:hypothetical protein [Thermoleophilia bacterium]